MGRRCDVIERVRIGIRAVVVVRVRRGQPGFDDVVVIVGVVILEARGVAHEQAGAAALMTHPPERRGLPTETRRGDEHRKQHEEVSEDLLHETREPQCGQPMMTRLTDS